MIYITVNPVFVNCILSKVIPVSLTTDDSRAFINDLLSLIQELQSVARLDFDDPHLIDEDYKAWTGWSKEQFDAMFDRISIHLRSSFNRSSKNAFGIFWIKVKTGLSFRQIGSLFNLPGDLESRRKRVADSFDSVSRIMTEYFVPNHLGTGHISRDAAKEHNTAYTRVNIIELFSSISA